MKSGRRFKHGFRGSHEIGCNRVPIPITRSGFFSQAGCRTMCPSETQGERRSNGLLEQDCYPGRTASKPRAAPQQLGKLKPVPARLRNAARRAAATGRPARDPLQRGEIAPVRTCAKARDRVDAESRLRFWQLRPGRIAAPWGRQADVAGGGVCCVPEASRNWFSLPSCWARPWFSTQSGRGSIPVRATR